MKSIVFTLILFVSPFIGAQGLIDGFFKGKGNLDLAFSANYQRSTEYFAGYNKIKYERNILSISAFGEYGVTNRWDVIANIPVINGKFQDGAVFTKYELIQAKIKGKKLSVIPAVGVSFPLSNYNTESGQAIGQRATVIAPKLVVQQELPKGMFIQAQSGYNYAIDPVVSSIPFSIKWGASFGKDYSFYTDLWYDHQTGLGDKDYKGDIPLGSFRELVVSYNRVGGVFFKQFNKLGAFVNYSYTINGRNTGQAIGVGMGIVVKL